MKQRNEQFDERMLARAAVPSLAPGRHKDELRRSLMQESRRRAEGGRAGGETSTHPWLRLLGYGLAILIATGLGAWLVHRRGALLASNESKPVVTKPSPTTNSLNPRGFSAAIGVSRDDQPGGQADAIADAIAKGNFELDQALTAAPGGRVYIYLIKPADARRTVFASDELLASNPWVTAKHQQEFQQAIAADKGGFIGESVSEMGNMVYRYRINLSDGMKEIFASDHEPDELVRRQHQAELAEAIAHKRGEFYKAIPHADGSTIYLMKVTLRAGTIKMYASREGAEGK